MVLFPQELRQGVCGKGEELAGSGDVMKLCVRI